MAQVGERFEALKGEFVVAEEVGGEVDLGQVGQGGHVGEGLEAVAAEGEALQVLELC